MFYKIIPKHGHYEVHINGKFYCSADTFHEAVKEAETYTKTGQRVVQLHQMEQSMHRVPPPKRRHLSNGKCSVTNYDKNENEILVQYDGDYQLERKMTNGSFTEAIW